MSKVFGKAVIYGMRPIRPIVNMPPNATAISITLSLFDVATAFVRFSDRIEEWVIGPSGDLLSADTWVLLSKRGESRLLMADATHERSKENERR